MKELAKECLNCINKPCTKGCPLNNDIPKFISSVKEDKIKEAYEVLCETTVLPAICGRICPHDSQCQGNCIKRFKFTPVSIGKIEASIADQAISNKWEIPKYTKEKRQEKIAVIGSGPASLTCAAFLSRHGYKVTIFEKHDYLGGLLVHGIPEFRLDRKIIEDSINKILSLGIKVIYNQELGDNLKITYLEKNFDAVFLGIGGNISNKMNIEGEYLEGVYGSNELLENNNHPDYTGKKVIISGGGNVAMDISRTIKKLGAEEVTVVYRRSEAEMPVEKEELENAIKEGIKFTYQTNILKALGNDFLTGIECIKTELVKKEGETRLSPVNIEGTNYIVDCDYLIMAVGSSPDEELLNYLDLEQDKKYIKINDNYQTSNPKIFAGGDVINTKKTVAYAAASGKKAAYAIIEYLNK